jgi:hypothetical protein
MRKVLSIVAATVVGLSVTMFVANPAYADANCSIGKFCLWTGQNGTGTKVEYNPAQDHCVNLAGVIVNNARWGWNRHTSATFYTYNGTNGTGGSGAWGPNGVAGPPNLSNYTNIESVCRW